MERYGESYRLEIETFITGLTNGQSASVDATDGLRAVYLAEAAGASLRLGKTIDLKSNCEITWNNELRNQTATVIITGGAQGVGLAIAQRLAREGARGIILSGRSIEKGEKAAAGIQSLGTDCIFVKADDHGYRKFQESELPSPV